ncbi:hypothetical protein L202_04521 [Cryptococcus amylolentus CBS 6039]|uniref:Uncharacterized protein n=1 Tax=Cryptococcus amylolentus CBS 6039 TaxID=1295533 RepID=A0A1E3HS89_9TREE|nr:hypothetical protein L202_04521 [Cryptococcus amylolentus CBS 6039]ODN79015.1 hypothetical protein L202_04521 [Cryptococcus amylolentus CBS 6039]
MDKSGWEVSKSRFIRRQCAICNSILILLYTIYHPTFTSRIPPYSPYRALHPQPPLRLSLAPPPGIPSLLGPSFLGPSLLGPSLLGPYLLGPWGWLGASSLPKARFNKGREVVGVLLDLLLLGGLIAWWVGMRASPEKRPGGLAVLPYVLMRWRWCTTPFAAAPADAARTNAGPPPTALVAALATALASRAIDDGLPAPATAQLPPEVQAQLDRMKPCSWPLPLSHPSFAGVVFGSVIYWHKST